MLNEQQAVDLENSILGTAIYEPDCVGTIVAELSQEDFTDVFDGMVFGAISALHLDGAPVTAVTVAERLDAEYAGAVKALLNYWTAPNNVPYYCRLLRERSRLRALQAAALSVIDATSLEDAGVALSQLNALMSTRKTVKILSASDAALDFLDRVQAKERPEYLHFGLPELDRKLYTELGDFIVVGGYPSSGKTLLCLQFAVELASKYKVGFFSLETSTSKLLDRTMANIARVPLPKIKNRDLNDADWAALSAASGAIAKLSLDYIDAGGMTVRDIQAVTLSRRYQVIFVDYLQLVPTAGDRGRYEKVTETSMALHTLARQNGITVVALAQLSRPEKEKGKPLPPTMASLRESGQIEQDADAILLLWPEDPNDNRSRRIAKLAKNKEGERAKLTLAFDGACQRLTVAEPTQGEKYRQLQRDIRRAGRGEYEQMEMERHLDPQSDEPF